MPSTLRFATSPWWWVKTAEEDLTRCDRVVGAGGSVGGRRVDGTVGAKRVEVEGWSRK